MSTQRIRSVSDRIMAAALDQLVSGLARLTLNANELLGNHQNVEQKKDPKPKQKDEKDEPVKLGHFDPKDEDKPMKAGQKDKGEPNKKDEHKPGKTNRKDEDKHKKECKRVKYGQKDEEEVHAIDEEEPMEVDAKKMWRSRRGGRQKRRTTWKSI